jgi:predicted SAM-dependent methyltransferase
VISSIYSKATLFLERIKRRFSSHRLPRNQTGKVYIHLGCGEINAPGFINVDALPFSHVHYNQGLEDLHIFPDEYADLMYASHVLEHFGHREVPRVLREWQRVLKRGGVLRLAVPDFDKIVGIYLSEERDVKKILSPLMGGQGNPYNFHKSVFNEAHLKKILLSAGFREVRIWNPQEVELHAFEDWASRQLEFSGKKYSISLNIEAVK